LQPGGASKIVEGDHVERIRSRDDQLSAVSLGRDDPVFASDLFGNQLDDVEIDVFQLLLRDRLLPELPAQIFQQHLFIEDLHLDEDLSQTILGLSLTRQRFREPLLRQDAIVYQHLAQGEPGSSFVLLSHLESTACEDKTETSFRRRRTSSRAGSLSALRLKKAR